MQTIDYKAAREHVMANYPNDPLLRHVALILLEQLPKVESVEVVRCRNCRHRHSRGNCAGRPMDFYCADGEK